MGLHHRKEGGDGAGDMTSNEPTHNPSQDRLERQGAAKGLARLILAEKPPFVLGIDGEWGSGKSSVMDMISWYLHEYRDGAGIVATSIPAWNPRGRSREQFPMGEATSPTSSWAAGSVVVVRANLWEHQHDEIPAVALLQAARDTLPPGAQHEATDEIKAIMASGGLNAVSVKGLPLGGASGEVSLDALRQAVLAGRADRFALQERQAQLSARFAKVIDEVRRIHGADRVVFVLDDLDRCFPAVALDLLEKVHLLFREPGCVTVIGIDTRVLELTVAKRYLNQGAHERDDDESKEAGTLAREYVEKIFDFSYRIPPVDDSRLRNYIAEMLEPLKEKTQHEDTAGNGADLTPSRWERFWARFIKTKPPSSGIAVDSRKSLLAEDIDVIADLFVEGASSCGASLRRAKRLVNSFIMYHSFACDTTVPKTIEALAATSVHSPAETARPAGSADSADAATGEKPTEADPASLTVNVAGPGADAAQAPEPGYLPFLMAAVTAIMVLHPSSYRRLSGGNAAADAEQWFVQRTVADANRLPASAVGLREAIIKGMRRVGLDDWWESPKKRTILVRAVVRYVQMMESPPGEKVTFGRYQDRPLTWRVLSTDSAGRRLLLCDDIVRLGPYHRDWKPRVTVTWDMCDLRRWLNGRPPTIGRSESGWEEWETPEKAAVWLGRGDTRDVSGEDVRQYWPAECFLEGFTESEVRRIDRVWVSTEDETWTAARVRQFWTESKQQHPSDTNDWVEPSRAAENWKRYWDIDKDDQEKVVPGGSDAYCRIFLLSLWEAENLLESDNDRIASWNGAPGWWWLRSPGSNGHSTAVVAPGGWLARDGLGVNNAAVGVRPALWLNP